MIMLKKLTTWLASNLSWLLIALLIFCNILLFRQNLQLKASVEDFTAKQKIQTGEKIEPFNASDIKNNSVQYNFDNGISKKIIFFSSTTCPFCKKQNPLWNEVVKQANNKKYEILEFFRDVEDKDKVFNYLKNNGVVKDDSDLSPKILFLKDEFLQKNKLNSTPITLIINENGVVEKTWFGLWNKAQIAEINDALDISIQPKS